MSYIDSSSVLEGATLFAANLLNETLENNGVVGPNTDALADLYVFDLAGAVLFSFDGDAIGEIAYHESEHYRVTRDFLNAPERYFKHLFDTPDEGGDDV